MAEYAMVAMLFIGAAIGFAASFVLRRFMEWMDEYRRDREHRRSLFCPDPMRDAKLVHVDEAATLRDVINASGFEFGVERGGDGAFIKRIESHQLTATEWAVVVTYASPTDQE